MHEMERHLLHILAILACCGCWVLLWQPRLPWPHNWGPGQATQSYPDATHSPLPRMALNTATNGHPAAVSLTLPVQGQADLPGGPLLPFISRLNQLRAAHCCFSNLLTLVSSCRQRRDHAGCRPRLPHWQKEGSSLLQPCTCPSSPACQADAPPLPLHARRWAWRLRSAAGA